MQLFDSHAHLGLVSDDPAEQLLSVQEAKNVGVEAIVCICNNLKEFTVIYDQLIQEPTIFFSIGISPSEVTQLPVDWENRLAELAMRDRVVAIGEIGLDYFHKYGSRDLQINLFVKQLEVARKVGLPVIIHNRDAGQDVLSVLRDNLPKRGGVLHCYSEDLEFARQALELNLFISFAGNVTYRSSRKLQKVASSIPLDRLLIETDTPFMTPSSHRGKRNRPSFIEETASFIAELRDLPAEEFADAVSVNSRHFFKLNDKLEAITTSND